jgi:hypothetical protein
MSENSSNRSGSQADGRLKTLQAIEKERDIETRDRNLMWIQLCFGAMTLIAVGFIFPIFEWISMLFYLSEWYTGA